MNGTEGMNMLSRDASNMGGALQEGRNIIACLKLRVI